MNKIIVGLFIVLLVGIGIYNYNAGGTGAPAGSNAFLGAEASATSTGSYCTTCPVKVLARNNDRQYAVFQNIGETDVYLYLATTTWGYHISTDPGVESPTSTIASLNGFELLANSANQFIINLDNLHVGDVWASSTAPSIQINVTEG